MTDTQLILNEIKRLALSVNELRESLPQRAKPRKKANPDYAQVLAYAQARGRQDLAQRFYSHYTDGKEPDEQWLNGGGKPIYNFKATFVQWENRDKPDAPITNGRSLWNE